MKRRLYYLTLPWLLIHPRPAVANPLGMTVHSGTATAVSTGPLLTVTAANNTHLNWQSFNIAAGETTLFQQPSSSSVVWNTIVGQSPSQIYGSLQANGVVVLMNGSGFYFGPNAYVKAASLVVSTAAGGPVEMGGGTGWQFNGPPPQASLIMEQSTPPPMVRCICWPRISKMRAASPCPVGTSVSARGKPWCWHRVPMAGDWVRKSRCRWVQ